MWIDMIVAKDREAMEQHKEKFTKEFLEWILANNESFGKMFVTQFSEPIVDEDGMRKMNMVTVQKYLDILELIKRIPYYQTPEYFQMFIDSNPTSVDIFELTQNVHSFNTWYEINKGNK